MWMTSLAAVMESQGVSSERDTPSMRNVAMTCKTVTQRVLTLRKRFRHLVCVFTVADKFSLGAIDVSQGNYVHELEQSHCCEEVETRTRKRHM